VTPPYSDIIDEKYPKINHLPNGVEQILHLLVKLLLLIGAV
jgi:hypothetical protein